MLFVRLVCWKPDMAAEKARSLESAGFRVDASELSNSSFVSGIRANPPAAVLIDLDRLPSHGREVAVALRSSKRTRHIPIVFAGGQEDKVEKIRRELPDAVFSGWNGVARALKNAIKNAPAEPVQPVPHMQRFAGSSLVKKLGISEGMQVSLLGAPEDFEEKLPDLPGNVDLRAEVTPKAKLVIWFVRSRHELETETEYIGARLPEGASLWIVHPKQAGRYSSDFNQNDVRQIGLRAGLVDYKVCAVDSDWSGLKFARKKSLGSKRSAP